MGSKRKRNVAWGYFRDFDFDGTMLRILMQEKTKAQADHWRAHFQAEG